MRRVRYSVAMSLDGYIAGPKGGYDWIVIDPGIDFDAMFKDCDTILIGRKSWEVTRTQNGGGGAMSGMKTYVFSRSLRQRDCPDATVSSDAWKTVAGLKAQPGKDIWLFGGGELFKSMLELGLVDAVEVGVIPVLLGGGVPMLPSPASRAKLKLVKHKVYRKTGTVGLSYEVQRAGPANRRVAAARRDAAA
jgi:dihydrofolate reductase